MSREVDAADGQTFSGVRCELCGVVRMNAMESRDGVVRCQDTFICDQVVALVQAARSTYGDLIEAGWIPVTAPDAAGIEAALAAGLAAHRLNHGTQLVTEERLWYAYCSCPGEWTFTGPSVDLAAAHDAHVAAALLPVVTQAQAEAWDEGYELRAKTLGMTPDPNPYRARAAAARVTTEPQ